MFIYGLPLGSIAMYKLFAPVIQMAGIVHVRRDPEQPRPQR